MRVLYVSHTAELGGAERSLLELLAALPPGVEPVILSPPGELAERAQALGAEAVSARFPSDPRLRGRSALEAAAVARTVRRVAREHRAHLVHANSLRAGALAALAAPPTVAHARDAELHPPGRLTVAALRRRAAAVIANSEHTRRSLAARGLTARVVSGGVDLGRFDARAGDREAARAELGVAADELVLCVVGQLTPWKGQAEAIRALALLEEPHTRLLIIGSAHFAHPANPYDVAAYAAQLPRLAHQLGVERRVLLLGERDDVPRLLSAGDVLLAPSWEEPFGRAVLEGMAAGLAVVAGDRGGPAEMIEPEVSGLLVKPRDPGALADAVRRLAADPRLRERLGAAARRRADAFSLAAHRDAVLAVYRDCGGQPGDRVGRQR